ncbi:hypothetical protein SDC9_120099 [bioreactor metagenome]|uniref:Uncharacterized protein n=1 Tax=bioreactor metagenome TaxID=1076179 RepID=A0A645C933_9ZZZZ
MVAVVQHQRHLGKALLPAFLRSAENHVFHLPTPECPGGLLPHHPADGVGEVGFAAAVGSDDGGDVFAEGEGGFIRKRFKALYFQRL